MTTTFFQLKRPRDRWRDSRGFTLIEILVVISIIAILAGLVVSMAPAAADKKIRARAQALISELDLAIGNYEAELGFLPQDNHQENPFNIYPTRPPLYYELKGTWATNPDNNEFETVDEQRLTSAELLAAFDDNIEGFANASPEKDEIKDFYPGLSPKNVKADPSNLVGIRYIVIPVPGPDGDFNPVRYNASSVDRVNVGSYDIWVDVMIGGKEVRIGNWK